MKISKDSEFAFQESPKESIGDRLRRLIGTRSVRAAAADWGLSFSTLNNYLTRGTEPSLNVAIKIANLEGVTAEWLATGVEVGIRDKQSHTSEPSQLSDEPLSYAWKMVYDSLEKEETEALLRLIHREGVKGILNAAQTETLDVQDFMSLSDSDRQRVLRLAKQIKEGASEEDIGIDPAHPTHKQAS